MTFRFHLSKAEINIWPFELNIWAHKMQGFARFVVKTNKSWFTGFGGKILNSNFHPCQKFDILQVCPATFPNVQLVF